jgi:segregation and condensation protein B
MFGRKGVKRLEPEDADSNRSEDPHGFSLEDLGSAYAEALSNSSTNPVISFSHSTGLPPTGLPPTGLPPTGLESNDQASTETQNDPSPSELQSEQLLAPPAVDESDDVHLSYESILEAMLFLGTSNNRPLSTDRLCELFRGYVPEDIERMVSELNASYRHHDRAFEIVKEVGGYRMQLATHLSVVRDRFYGRIKETQLTQSAIDCLALVAYQPGIAREELEKQWNQPASSMLSTLVRKGLLRIDRQEGAKGATSRYHTTERFLEIIGLASLTDLPLSEDL